MAFAVPELGQSRGHPYRFILVLVSMRRRCSILTAFQVHTHTESANTYQAIVRTCTAHRKCSARSDYPSAPKWHVHLPRNASRSSIYVCGCKKYRWWMRDLRVYWDYVIACLSSATLCLPFQLTLQYNQLDICSEDVCDRAKTFKHAAYEYDRSSRPTGNRFPRGC